MEKDIPEKKIQIKENLEEKIYGTNITYTEFGRDFEKGLITHEDVIQISYYMFRDYPSLSAIVADKYPYLFIDEYQDTEPDTIELVLDYHLKRNPHLPYLPGLEPGSLGIQPAIANPTPADHHDTPARLFHQTSNLLDTASAWHRCFRHP